MSDEGPKLFANKPKKSARLKASTMAAESSTGPTAPPPPPPPPSVKAPFLQRFTFYKTLALVVSLTVGAYAFARTVLKVGPKEEEKSENPTTSTSSSTTPAPTPTPTPAASVSNESAIQRPPIPEDQQRELFKWMLEEKRKAKPINSEEKKRLDEEKAVLKQLIRAKSLPKI